MNVVFDPYGDARSRFDIKQYFFSVKLIYKYKKCKKNKNYTNVRNKLYKIVNGSILKFDTLIHKPQIYI